MATVTQRDSSMHQTTTRDTLNANLDAADYRPNLRFEYEFENFLHPFVGRLIEELNNESLSGLLDPEFHKSLKHRFFANFYAAQGSPTNIQSFDKEIELGRSGAYSTYNWELLFHFPLAIARHLSKNRRFAEARRWFHFIFDPTCNDTSVEVPGRFWRFLGFRDGRPAARIETIVELLSKPVEECTAEEQLLQEDALQSYRDAMRYPFQPHAVARSRRISYQFAVIMNYLDNEIAWGDHLFQQDTIETINEATQHYVLASNILGKRPQRLPSRGTTRPRTFFDLRDGAGPMANALVDLEGKLPFNLGTYDLRDANVEASGPLFGMGRTLYFCIPPNEKLLGYWDTVADRRFKIRNCMNIEGIVRQLPLFDPPLDPGMLIKATAAGIDIAAISGGLNQAAGPLRCIFLIQKALELAAEVRGLGAALLSALEKGEGEQMALLSVGHEIKLQQAMQDVRFLQWKQAEESTETLMRGRASALERYRYYQRLIGIPADRDATPDVLPLDRRELSEENFDEVHESLVGQYERPVPTNAYPRLQLAGDASPTTQAGATGTGRLSLNRNEDADLNLHDPNSRNLQLSAGVSDGIFGVLAMLPLFEVKAAFWGVGGGSVLTGGQIFSGAGQIISGALRTAAAFEQSMGASSSKTASYERRADDWLLQLNLAGRELIQIGRQIIGSLLLEQIARREYLNVQKQIEQAQERDRFLREKFTNQELYAWMHGELSRLYYDYYRFAFEIARKAEQAMKRELMRPELENVEHVRFNYWDGGRQGLLAGEMLQLDVKRLEMAYHESNKREYELTKHVSMRQLDPMALLALKATGTCELTLPEWLFDMDCPGHYLRRLKHVSLSIPAVAGPYTSVNCTLSLLRSTVRRSPAMAEGERDGGYQRTDSEDARFSDHFGTIQTVVTSGGSNDGGMFETNLRDERVLPFEGAGAESTWRLELPKEFRQFDYNTISDVIMHVRFTARPGGETLRNASTGRLNQLLAANGEAGFALLLSLKHDFPTEWSLFTHDAGPFRAAFDRRHFPYLVQDRTVTVQELGVYLVDSAAVRGGLLTSEGGQVEAINDALKSGHPAQFTLPPSLLNADGSAQNFLLVKYTVA